MFRKNIMLVSCLVNSSTLKMEAICFFETSGFPRTQQVLFIAAAPTNSNLKKMK
jgi:hypothetical protein